MSGKSTVAAAEVGVHTDETPEGWVSRPVHAIFNSFGGGTPSKANPAYWGGAIPWLSSGDIKSCRIDSASEFISKAALENSSANVCRAGSVVVVVRSGILAHTLPVAVLRCRAAINQDIKCFDSGDDQLNAWLALAFRASAKNILALNREGTTVQSVKYDTLRDFELPVPPATEQRRIIDKIDELLEHVNASREHLAKVPKILKAFRQSVLAAACSGRLTEDWRSSNVPLQSSADDLMKRIFEARAERARRGMLPIRRGLAPETVEGGDPIELPESWRWVAWNDLVDWVTYGFTRPMPHQPQGIPIVTAKNIVDGQIDFSTVDFTTKSAFSELSDKDRPRKGEILVTKDGSIGRAAIVQSDEPFCINQSVALLRFGGLTAFAPYLKCVIEAPFTQGLIEEGAKGTAIRHISITTFGRFPVPLPPIQEQREIVRRVEILFKLADKIGKRVRAATKRADRLTQAVLAKAFRGELVPTEAELARREEREYESASILLERIKGQRKGVSASRNGHKRRM